MQAAEAAVTSRRLVWTVLAAAVVAQTTVSVAEMGVPTLAPFLKTHFGLSAAGVGLLISALNTGRIFGAFPAGQMVDHIGERHVMLVGGTGLSVMLAAASLGSTVGVVALLFAVAGVFGGSAAPAGTRLIYVLFAAARRGTVMGIRQSAVPLGGLIAALALPVIAREHGLRAALLCAAALPLCGAIWAWFGVGALDVAPRGVRPAGQRRRDLRAVAKDRNTRFAIAWAVIFIGGQYAIVTYLILSLTNNVGLSLGGAAALLAVAQFGGMAGRVWWGMFSDGPLEGRRKPALQWITAGGICSAGALAAMPRGAPLPLLVPVAAVAGISLIGWQGIWASLVSELAPQHAIGTAVGYGLTFTNVAIVVWPPVLGLVADAAGSFRAAWMVLTVALTLSLLALAAVDEPWSPEGAVA
jgi:sugar phosphate permease